MLQRKIQYLNGSVPSTVSIIGNDRADKLLKETNEVGGSVGGLPGRARGDGEPGAGTHGDCCH